MVWYYHMVARVRTILQNHNDTCAYHGTYVRTRVVRTYDGTHNLISKTTRSTSTQVQQCVHVYATYKCTIPSLGRAHVSHGTRVPWYSQDTCTYHGTYVRMYVRTYYTCTMVPSNGTCVFLCTYTSTYQYVRMLAADIVLAIPAVDLAVEAAM
jgi:hypothetical protein